LGYLQTTAGSKVKIHFSFLTSSSVLFDAVFIPGGQQSVNSLKRDPAVREFIFETYKHAKAIGASGDGAQLLEKAGILDMSEESDDAIIMGGNAKNVSAKFISAVAKHRNWQRERLLRVDLEPRSTPNRKSA